MVQATPASNCLQQLCVYPGMAHQGYKTLAAIPEGIQSFCYVGQDGHLCQSSWRPDHAQAMNGAHVAPSECSTGGNCSIVAQPDTELHVHMGSLDGSQDNWHHTIGMDPSFVPAVMRAEAKVQSQRQVQMASSYAAPQQKGHQLCLLKCGKTASMTGMAVPKQKDSLNKIVEVILNTMPHPIQYRRSNCAQSWLQLWGERRLVQE